MRHKHQFAPGPRYPLRYGSAPTKVCWCGTCRLTAPWSGAVPMFGPYRAVDGEFYLDQEDCDA